MAIRKILFVFIIISLWGCYTFAADPIKMGYFMLPPLQYIDEAATPPTGASIAYFEALSSQMGYEVEWVGPLPLLRLSEHLKRGLVDGTVGFNKFSALADFLYYTNTPMFLAQPTLFVRKDNPLTRIRSIEDIRGYHIGLNVSISGIYTPLIDDHRDALSLETLGGEEWIDQNIRKLRAGRIDAIFARHPYSILFVTAKLRVDDQIKTLSIPDPPTPMYVVFSKASKRGRELLEQCNAVLPQFDLNHDELVQKELAAAKQP